MRQRGKRILGGRRAVHERAGPERGSPRDTAIVNRRDRRVGQPRSAASSA